MSPALDPPIIPPDGRPAAPPAGASTTHRPEAGSRPATPREARLFLWRAGFDAGVQARAFTDAGAQAEGLRRDARQRQRELDAAFEAGRRAQARTDLGTIAAALRREAAARQVQLLDELIGVLARAIADSYPARHRRVRQPEAGRSAPARPARGAAVSADASTAEARPSPRIQPGRAATQPAHEPSPPPQPARGGRRRVA